jgi:hypothetical protein
MGEKEESEFKGKEKKSFGSDSILSGVYKCARS